MWQSKEYFGCQLLSRCTQAANGIMELTTLTKSKIEIGDRIVAILADHKAAAGVKGNVGSGGDCRVESALPGLRIGHTCDEELIHFSTLASFMSLKKRYVKGPSRSLRRLSSSDVYTCTACK